MQSTQAQILKHHGGDAEHARQMITESYARRHDAAFWTFWDAQMALAIAPGELLMDVGAGIGQFVNDLALRYPHNTVLGIDAAEYMLAAQLALPANGRFLKDDLNQPAAPIELGAVAVVMANMLVHELPQPVNLFKAVYTWLKPGGRFCVIDLVRQPLQDYLEHKYSPLQIWQEPMPRAQLEDVFEHFLEHNRYHADDLIYLLTQAGFKVVDVTPQNSGRMVRIVVEK
jgi:SAM-dependent methyltransferase